MRIGEILTKSAVIDTKSLDDALTYASYKGIPLGRALRVLRHITEEDLSRALDAQIAFRKGLPADVVLIVLKSAYSSNRTFLQALQASSTVQPDSYPPGLVDELSGKKAKVTTSSIPVAPSAAPVRADANSLEGKTHGELIKIGDSAFLSNDLESAEKAYTRARDLIQDAYGVPPSTVAHVLMKLANLYFASDRFKEAQPLYERVLETQKKVFGSGSPEATRAFEDLGDLFDIQDNLPEAQQYFDQALDSLVQQKQLVDDTTSRLFGKLVSLCNRSGQPPARARLGELAIDSGLLSQEKVQAALQTAKETNEPIGTVLRDQHSLDDKQIESLMFAQVLVKQSTMPAPVAVRAIKFAAARKTSLKELADSGKLLTSKDLDDENYKQLVLEQEHMLSAEAKLGPDHPDVAAIAQRIAAIHLVRKDRGAAEAFLKRSLSILKKSAQPDSTALLQATENLAQVYCQYAKYADAQPLLLKCLEYRQSMGKGESVETANCLWLIAKVELAQANHSTALSFMRSARAIYDKLGGSDTPQQLLEQMAASCLETGMSVDLEPVLTQLITNAKRNDRGFEPETAQYMEQLGDYYASNGKNDAAQAQYFASMQIFERAPGTEARVKAVSAKLAKAAEMSRAPK